MAPPSVELRPIGIGIPGEGVGLYSIGGSDAFENLTSRAAPLAPVIVKSVNPASSSSAVGGLTGSRLRASGLLATLSFASAAAFSSTLIGGGGSGAASFPFLLPFLAGGLAMQMKGWRESNC